MPRQIRSPAPNPFLSTKACWSMIRSIGLLVLFVLVGSGPRLPLQLEVLLAGNSADVFRCHCRNELRSISITMPYVMSLVQFPRLLSCRSLLQSFFCAGDSAAVPWMWFRSSSTAHLSATCAGHSLRRAATYKRPWTASFL